MMAMNHMPQPLRNQGELPRCLTVYLLKCHPFSA